MSTCNTTFISEALARHARERGYAPAYVWLDELLEHDTYTYADLHREALQVASLLHKEATRGDRVILAMPQGPEFVSAFYGCLYAGMIAVPVPAPQNPRRDRMVDRLVKISQDCGATLVVTNEENRASFDDKPVQVWTWQTLMAQPITLAEPVEVEPQTVAYLQYTSGSTGTPKGAVITHRAAAVNVSATIEFFEYTQELRSLTWMPHFHDFCLVEGLLVPLTVGGIAYGMAPETFLKRPTLWLQAIDKYRIAASSAPNFAFDFVRSRRAELGDTRLDLSCWRVANNASENNRRQTIDAFHATFAEHGYQPQTMCPAYGMAETTLGLSLTKPDKKPTFLRLNVAALGEDRVVPVADEEAGIDLVACGQPIGDVRFAIVDPNTLQRCSANRVGEIWVQTDATAAGYWHNPEQSRETFEAKIVGEVGNYLRTGDLGFIHEGLTYICGRLKDLVIIDGTNHYPADIEFSAITGHPTLRPVAAAFSHDRGSGERLYLLVESRGPVKDEVVRAVHDKVASDIGIVPAVVALVKPGSLIKTSSGKIKRQACKKLFLENKLDPLLVRSFVKDGAKAPQTLTHPMNYLRHRLAELCGLEPHEIKPSQAFASMGLSSRQAVALVAELEDLLPGHRLPATLLWEYPNPKSLSGYLQTLSNDQVPVQTDQARPENKPMAIVGMAVRFPGAPDLEAYWNLLRECGLGIDKVPGDRWPQGIVVPTTANGQQRNMPHEGGFIEEPARFDAAFFGIAPREAERMDPRQRHVLEVAWHALEDAGIDPRRLEGSQTGVFLGLCGNDFGGGTLADPELDVTAVAGEAISIAANRLSYCLGLQGPSLAVDTACSSSLTALHLACESLRSGDASLALAGGVSLILRPDVTAAFCASGMLAQDARCKTFGADADGYVRAEGCGLVVVKRLGEALADGDRIYGLVHGTAINQDGRSNGLTAPNQTAQENVLRKALARAGIEAHAVDYVEAHGTGTPLGDPIEVRAIGKVYRDRRNGEPLRLGSVKANIGHLEAAAGIAGLIKMMLALHHEKLPGHRIGKPFNPLLGLDEGGLNIQTETTHWARGERPRFAGISSFGFGGSNAHVIVGEAPVHRPEQADPVPFLALSAESESALHEVARRFASHLADKPEQWRPMAAASLYRRAHLGHRLALPISGQTQWQQQLERIAAGERPPGVAMAQAASTGTVFVFPGHGFLRAGLCASLHQHNTVFREAFERCCSLVRPQLGMPLSQVLFTEPASKELGDPRFNQPLHFALLYALASCWLDAGVRPNAVIGHSGGELVAGHLAGAYDLGTGMAMALRRGQIVASSPRGAMVSVLADAAFLEEVLAPHRDKVAIAVHNGGDSVVLSGEVAALEVITDACAQVEKPFKWLPIAYPSHSPLMENAKVELQQAFADLEFDAPRLPFISSALGEQVNRPLDAAYWAHHLRTTVRFATAVEVARNAGHQLFVEMVPFAVLGTHGSSLGGTWLQGHDEDESACPIQTALAQYHVAGGSLAPSESAPFHPLPLYPFEGRHYPLRAPQAPGGRTPQTSVLGARLPVAEKIFQMQAGLGTSRWLNQHVVSGSKLAPGALFLTLALQAVVETGNPSVIGLEDFEIETPFLLDHGSLLQTSIEDVDRITFYQGDNDGQSWRRNATIRYLTGSPDETVPPNAYRGALPDVADFYPNLEARGYAYGPDFRVVHALTQDGGRIIADIHLPKHLSEEWVCHPILLDGCFQALSALPDLGHDVWLPGRVALLSLLRRPGNRVRCVAELLSRSETSMIANITIYNDTGLPSMLVRGLELTPVRAHTTQMHQLSWLPVEPTQRYEGNPLVLVGREPELLQQYRTQLVRKGYHAVIYDETQGFPEAGQPLELIDLATTSNDAPSCSAQLVRLSRLGNEARASGQRFRIWSVTRDGSAVVPSDQPNPSMAAYHGAMRCWASERPDEVGGLVDLPADLAPFELPELLADIIRFSGYGHELAWRSSSWFQSHLEPAPNQPASTEPRPTGTVLILGGTGHLGLYFAQDLVKRGCRHLLLVGRSTTPSLCETKQERIRAMEAMGAKLAITDLTMLEEGGFAQCQAEGWPSISGVIHAAGVVPDGLVEHLTAEQIAAALAAKWTSAIRLEAFLANHQPQYLVYFTSLANTLGSPGQGAYAAANAAIEALAQQQRTRGLPAYCIAFPAWHEVGNYGEQAETFEQKGIAGMTPREGLHLVAELLASPPGNRVCLGLDPAALAHHLPEMAQKPLLAHYFSASEPTVEAYGGPRAVVARVLGARPEEVDEHKPFARLGLDSLAMIRLQRSIAHQFGQELPISEIMACGSIRGLAARLAMLPACDNREEDMELEGVL